MMGDGGRRVERHSAKRWQVFRALPARGVAIQFPVPIYLRISNSRPMCHTLRIPARRHRLPSPRGVVPCRMRASILPTSPHSPVIPRHRFVLIENIASTRRPAAAVIPSA